MSHWSMLVTGQDVEAQMAPFDENLEVPRYMARTKAQIIADERESIERYRDGSMYQEFLTDPAAYFKKIVERGGRVNYGHLAYISTEFPKKLEWTDEQVYAEAVKWDIDETFEDGTPYIDADGNEWSERNPKSKWDYWRVGGRWAGGLRLREGATGTLNDLSWEWGSTSRDDRPSPTTHADIALRKDIDVAESGPTYGILHEGEWIARGEMGWFGISHSETCSEEEWPAKWREFVEALPGDTVLTVVDCHV